MPGYSGYGLSVLLCVPLIGLFKFDVIAVFRKTGTIVPFGELHPIMHF